MLVTTNNPVRTFTITLSEYEASILRKVCSNIGGSPFASPRKVTQDLDSQLSRLDVLRAPAATKGVINFEDSI